MKGGEILEVITTTNYHKIIFTREEFTDAVSSEDKFVKFYESILKMCVENERKMKNENDKKQL